MPKYDGKYMTSGFMLTDSKSSGEICPEELVTECTMPPNLLRHLENKHLLLKDEDVWSFFLFFLGWWQGGEENLRPL